MVSECGPDSFGSHMGPAVSFVNTAKGLGFLQNLEFFDYLSDCSVLRYDSTPSQGIS